MVFGGPSTGGDPGALDRVLTRARGVRVREMPGDTRTLLEERDPVAVRALREALRIADLPGFVCMCWGDVALDFFGAAERPLTTVTLHHGCSIRWDGWPQDALLADGVRSLEWLAVRGVSSPLREFRAAEQRQAEADRTARRWVAEIPAALAPYATLFLDTSRTGGGLTGPQIAEVRAILLVSHPHPLDRVLCLCTWYAAGTGAYSGHPTHERIPAQFLDLESLADFATAVDLADDTATAGAVRYLLSWDTRNRLAHLLAALSPAARRKILRHARDAESRRWLQRRITGLQ
ncbi:hypothetical protein [Nocardia seriolae]|uniref:Uncharacterized protein n=1 Tax=Nocardia seriolae TaxID=37332 RepID=A0ABC9Z0Y6_9NOCA|nr:hypothetical protein [Nocardia seriolae]BEK98884.1 hypothetical protein NSER024013_67900 [Nocardia seriolae]GAM49077.1 hypothetical protein NS07_v2contig00095-0030 [Nocardia seriolae]GAP31001.1 hypothetical protein NSK11_contig00100-0030 [Nocardia seriolae]